MDDWTESTKRENEYQEIIDFLIYCKTVYGKEFNINFTDGFARYQSSDMKIVEILVWTKNIPEYMKIVDFILDEFEDEYDRNDPCLLRFSLEWKEYQLFEYLVYKYKMNIN